MATKLKKKVTNVVDPILASLVPPAKARLRHHRRREVGGLGQTLAKIRVQAGMTQEQLAMDAGVSLKSLRKIEQGGSGVTLTTLQKLVSFLGYELQIISQADAVRGTP